MKSVNIRSLRQNTSDLMERIALGETVEIRRRNQPVAVLKPLEEENKHRRPRPNFRKRIRAIYGEQLLAKTTTELLAQERGER